MRKVNCWEIKKCGREPGGNKTVDNGICPATIDESSNGLNGGINGGRICWAVAGTFCGGIVQGDFAKKTVSCMTCDFFIQVKRLEFIGTFMLLKEGQSYSTSRRPDSV